MANLTKKKSLASCFQIEELSSIIKESRTDLETLRAKFSFNQKSGRKKEEELKQCVSHAEQLEEEVMQLKAKVCTAVLLRSGSLFGLVVVMIL